MTETSRSGRTVTGQEKRIPAGLKRVIMVDGKLAEVALTPTDEVKEWGLLDTSNNTWLGGKDGPFRFTEYDLARAQRQVLAARIPCPVTRISVEPFTSADRKLDEIALQNSEEEAMRIIEKRGY